MAYVKLENSALAVRQRTAPAIAPAVYETRRAETPTASRYGLGAFSFDALAGDVHLSPMILLGAGAIALVLAGLLLRPRVDSVGRKLSGGAKRAKGAQVPVWQMAVIALGAGAGGYLLGKYGSKL